VVPPIGFEPTTVGLEGLWEASDAVLASRPLSGSVRPESDNDDRRAAQFERDSSQFSSRLTRRGSGLLARLHPNRSVPLQQPAERRVA
jgi:hypothetical protein